MKANEKKLKGFERIRNFTLEECQEYIENQYLNESEDKQIMEVDDIFEYMKSLGYSTIDEIKEKYNLE